MNKKDIILKLKELNFDNSDYWVIAGAALVLHGVRNETKDIDLACSKNLFNYLLLQGYSVDRTKLGYRKITLTEDIEIFEEWETTGINIIDGIPTANLENIRKMKMQMGREKDFQDIKLIDEIQKKK